MSTGPHRGIPNHLAIENCRTGTVSPGAVPSLDVAVQAYQSTGGYLAPQAIFGTDPLSHSPALLQQRCRELDRLLLPPEDIFGFTVNGHYQPFASSLTSFITLTNQLSASV